MNGLPARGDLVLLTGASGVVGRALLEVLPPERTLCLVHREPVVGVPSVAGDLCAPRFGWDARRFDALAERVAVVVHSAALTEWGLAPERYRGPNVEGTRTVVDLARRAGAALHLVSSAFVAALHGPELSAGNVVAPYIRSKREAEEIVAASGLAWSVHRPTNLVGRSVDGVTSRGQIIQTMADWICRGRAPFFPAAPGNRVDVLAQDHCAVPIARDALAGVTGEQNWMTTGSAAMTVDEALDVLADHAADRGRPLARRPRAVDPADLGADDLAALPPLAARYIRVLADVSEVTAAAGGVLPTSMPRLARRHDLPAVTDTEALRRTLRAAGGDPSTPASAIAPAAAPAAERRGALR